MVSMSILGRLYRTSSLLVDAIRKFVIPEENEDYAAPRDPDAMVIDPELSGEPSTTTVEMKSTMRAFPPPLFSRISIPQQYK